MAHCRLSYSVSRWWLDYQQTPLSRSATAPLLPRDCCRQSCRQACSCCSALGGLVAEPFSAIALETHVPTGRGTGLLKDARRACLHVCSSHLLSSSSQLCQDRRFYYKAILLKYPELGLTHHPYPRIHHTNPPSNYRIKRCSDDSVAAAHSCMSCLRMRHSSKPPSALPLFHFTRLFHHCHHALSLTPAQTRLGRAPAQPPPRPATRCRPGTRARPDG